ncbi:MAG: hypothetical protein DRH50_02170 [Deltaproteobacteria bacterium]|nr:MAG: hypothetical protein DRH50_02170 [Deltaproteobacteria bacterium]
MTGFHKPLKKLDCGLRLENCTCLDGKNKLLGIRLFHGFIKKQLAPNDYKRGLNKKVLDKSSVPLRMSNLWLNRRPRKGGEPD